jgi:type I restriction enzyme, S subunit
LISTDLKHASLTDAEMAKFGIQEGDILFNRTNSNELVGKTGLWDGRFPAAAASYFIRVRVDREVVCPRWIWRFMNSATMKGRLFAMARGAIGQANINSHELKSFALPLPPLEEQRRIIGLLDRAAEISRRADAAASRPAPSSPRFFSICSAIPPAIQRGGQSKSWPNWRTSVQG